MLVEFFGVPGSGKTYYAHLYKESLKQNKKRYIDISRYNGMPFWLKVFYKLADYVIKILPRYRKQVAEYKEVCRECPREALFIPFSLDYCIKDIVLYSFANTFFRHSRRIIINDEGQLHRLIFLIVQFNCSIDLALEIYLSHKHDGTIRYVQTSSKQAFQNIKNRNRKVCPMDEMDDILLKNYINTFEKVCKEIIRRDCSEIEII